MTTLSPTEIDALASLLNLQLGNAAEPVAETVATLVDSGSKLLEKTRASAEGASQSSEKPAMLRRATPSDDPLNAIVRWFDIPPTGDGPLTGRTVSVKDSIFVAGVPATCGYKGLESFIPRTNATVVNRVLQAGGRIVATTNMDCFGFAASGETSGYGRTLNPVAREHLAGGSSSGAAAALSYEAVDMSIGSDQGGSIRVPAAWCGALGLKPTHGLVPYSGIAGIDQLIDHVGPMGRSVEDVATLLQVIAGPDGADPRQHGALQQSSFELGTPVDTLKGVRIGVLAEGVENSRLHDSPETIAVLNETCDQLSALGASVKRVSVPEHITMSDASFACNVEGMASLLRSGGQGYGHLGKYDVGFADSLNRALTDQPELLSLQMKVAWLAGSLLSNRHGGAAYGAARSDLAAQTDRYARIFDVVDVLIMPTTPSPALEARSGSQQPDDLLQRGWSMLSNTSPFNATGMPALSMPTGMIGGLPIGIMIVAAKGNDALLLNIARKYEQMVGWHLAPELSTKSPWK